jgi:hypothetical protein
MPQLQLCSYANFSTCVLVTLLVMLQCPCYNSIHVPLLQLCSNVPVTADVNSHAPVTTVCILNNLFLPF